MGEAAPMCPLWIGHRWVGPPPATKDPIVKIDPAAQPSTPSHYIKSVLEVQELQSRWKKKKSPFHMYARSPQFVAPVRTSIYRWWLDLTGEKSIFMFDAWESAAVITTSIQWKHFIVLKLCGLAWFVLFTKQEWTRPHQKRLGLLQDPSLHMVHRGLKLEILS